jgi:hypothetical protein
MFSFNYSLVPFPFDLCPLRCWLCNGRAAARRGCLSRRLPPLRLAHWDLWKRLYSWPRSDHSFPISSVGLCPFRLVFRRKHQRKFKPPAPPFALGGLPRQQWQQQQQQQQWWQCLANHSLLGGWRIRRATSGSP